MQPVFRKPVAAGFMPARSARASGSLHRVFEQAWLRDRGGQLAGNTTQAILGVLCCAHSTPVLGGGGPVALLLQKECSRPLLTGGVVKPFVTIDGALPLAKLHPGIRALCRVGQNFRCPDLRLPRSFTVIDTSPVNRGLGPGI